MLVEIVVVFLLKGDFFFFFFPCSIIHDRSAVTLTCFFTGSQSLESDVQDRVQKCQSQLKQQLLSQNIQNNIPLTGVSNFFGSSSALPSFGGNSQATVPSIMFQTPRMPSRMPSLFNATPNAAGNLIGQGSPASLMSQVAERRLMQQLARPLGNTSIRNTQQGIQPTDPTPQQQTTIDQQNMLQNLQLQSGIANLQLPPLCKFSLLNNIKCIVVISGSLDGSFFVYASH